MLFHRNVESAFKFWSEQRFRQNSSYHKSFVTWPLFHVQTVSYSELLSPECKLFYVTKYNVEKYILNFFLLAPWPVFPSIWLHVTILHIKITDFDCSDKPPTLDRLKIFPAKFFIFLQSCKFQSELFWARYWPRRRILH